MLTYLYRPLNVIDIGLGLIEGCVLGLYVFRISQVFSYGIFRVVYLLKIPYGQLCAGQRSVKPANGQPFQAGLTPFELQSLKVTGQWVKSYQNYSGLVAK